MKQFVGTLAVESFSPYPQLHLSYLPFRRRISIFVQLRYTYTLKPSAPGCNLPVGTVQKNDYICQTQSNGINFI